MITQTDAQPHASAHAGLLAIGLILAVATAATPIPAYAQPGGSASLIAPFTLLLDTSELSAPTPLAHLEILVTQDTIAVPEGGEASFEVALSRPPASPLSLSVARVSGDADIAVLTTSVTFDATDWHVLKKVTVRAAADDDGEPGAAGVLIAADGLLASVTAVEKELTPIASHAGRFAGYEGASTCKGCHPREATDMLGTIHYQWKGSTERLVAPSEPLQGKLGGINDFCTTPDISWLSILTTADKAAVPGGCAKCHAGLGLKPEPVDVPEQIDNIDCLMCHGRSYSRNVESVDGAWRLAPSPAASNFQDVVLPGKAECLRCHSKSGGGNNFKRGDIEEFHKSPTADFDVHMASVADGGKGLTCVSCHVFRASDGSFDHAISGRGADLRPVEGQPLSCTRTGCHASSPHGASNASYATLNRHVAKVNCTVCHIPSFARVAPTDMRRDFGRPGELLFTTGLYEPAMDRVANVVPEYAFWNGTSRIYNLHDKAADYDAGGVTRMAAPVGSLNDPDSRLFAFKRHTAAQPLAANGEIIPLKMGILFQTGDNLTAILKGAEGVGVDPAGYEMVETERWMGLFHEVAPKGDALACASCHTSLGGTRTPFADLGYAPTRPVSPTCSQGCHGDESREWRGKGFVKGHDIHVRDKRRPCSACHAITGR